ncbi:ACP S-malonyltransferase [Natronospirillum operosum]|uniref:Malonyl CoA-acyl carrier protein transacylase n=1 Tax=Natronospirillum operosum TaxID=2759953 RepID=A0A4Z0WBU1_9GAMM|nr:ACP S-malonyltransferase [Natronospirillum operosum]TGG95622.1 ACP S-malonyltransferase [Natronospirillum operosum]
MTDHKRAFLFPGQGSQAVGMLGDMIANADVVRDTFGEAGEALGYDLLDLVSNGPEDSLNATERTQPAILTASVALWRLWQHKGGPVPDYLAGHSLGEYSALVAAGVLKFADAVRLVEKRGQLMQSAVPAGEGGMAAIIGLTDEQVLEACAAAGTDVCEAVNFNAPGQVVIAGSKAGVDKGMAAAKELGAKRALPLAVSAPSHCVLMKPAAESLAAELASIDLQPAQIPIVQNVDARAYTEVAILRTNLVEQLYRPVQWVQTVQNLAAEGVGEAFECGPGKVLAGLVKRIERSMTVSPLEQPSAFEDAVNAARN